MPHTPDPFFEPMSGAVMPRFTMPPTFMRLPVMDLDHPRIGDVDIGIVGIPWDGGTTNRPGARHGPRQMRDLSTMIRRMHPVTGLIPFDITNVADLGDCSVNPAGLEDTLERITTLYKAIAAKGIAPLSVGGDHLTTLPVLRGIVGGTPLGSIHFDSHTDLNDAYFNGCKLTHGTPFRRAIEEGLLDPKRVVMIGLRGTKYDTSDIDYAAEVGARMITIEEFRDLGLEATMREARRVVGDHPCYITFDIDFIDPAYAPGTGTPEIGGPTSFEAQQCVRALSGVNVVAADLVEVSPPFDPSGNTAWVGVSILFELLCVLAEAVARRRDRVR